MIKYDGQSLKRRIINGNPVGRVYIGSNKVWETSEGYGIRWEHMGDGTAERIGNMTYHATLPIQSKMKRCIVKENGDIQYVSDSDWTKDTEGNTIDYTATGQDVMVEIPEHYYETGQYTDNGTVYDYIMLYPTVHLGKKVPKHYVGAFEAMLDRTNNKLYSTCKTNIVYDNNDNVVIGDLTYTDDAATYRGGNNASTTYGDDTATTLLGKPATNITISNYAQYAINRGNKYAMIHWEAKQCINRLFVVEYAQFNSQATFNSSLTNDGYHQGGLGSGVTSINGSAWSSQLGYNPFIPCGVTLRLGSQTGVVTCTPAVGLGADSTSITVSVPSYRGIENPFGHINEVTNGIYLYGEDNRNYIFTAIDGWNVRSFTYSNSSTPANGFELRDSQLPLTGGWIKDYLWDKHGDFIPKSQDSSYSSKNLFDYSYGQNAVAKRVRLGGDARDGSSAGLFYFAGSIEVDSAHVRSGSRLLKMS